LKKNTMPIPDFSNFNELSTERLELRQLRESDADAVFFLRSDEEVNRYIRRPRATTTDEALAFIMRMREGVAQNKTLQWGITLKGNPHLIGSICLWNFTANYDCAELGYALHPDFQGNGIMDEAVKVVLRVAFESLLLKSVEAFTNKDNRASKSLLERNGFSHAVLRKDDDYPENMIYVLDGKL
jgi:[ribosomal protein S5]-alanine N-acetyltransferase